MDGNLRKLFQQHIPHVHWQSIETGMTGRGIPDSNGCYNGTEFWVEYKTTQHWSVGLRPEQVGWISRRVRYGGKVFIAVRRVVKGKPRTPNADELYIFDGADAKHLVAYGLKDTTPLYFGINGPVFWNWDIISTILCNCPR